MFQVGECIHYSTSGLCRVEEIKQLQMSGADSDRLYYCLKPLDESRSMIYTPVDNQKVIMRRALTRDEAAALIDQIPSIKQLDIPDEKNREKQYKDALLSADCMTWVRVIKTLYRRREERTRHGKKVTATEEKYFRNTSELLHRELALAMEMSPKEVEDYISVHVEKVSCSTR